MQPTVGQLRDVLVERVSAGQLTAPALLLALLAREQFLLSIEASPLREQVRAHLSQGPPHVLVAHVRRAVVQRHMRARAVERAMP